MQRHAHAAMLGRCVLGADSKEDCSTESANLQRDVRDDTTRRDIVEDGTTGCVAHTVEAARRFMADPASRRSCSPSSATTKAPPLPALSGSGRTTPRSSSTAASSCARNTASADLTVPRDRAPAAKPPHWSATLPYEAREHFKHAGTDGTDQWSYTTYTPLELRPDDAAA
ncbi:hypothetical protein [Streptomyces sp. NRRL B-3648]|uniref:hypothetical protein n=1 Tax=Streptomyces sp. NRRL B-3648 TaxID=1519493 RepID=UPI00131E4FA0|nr:hypothetical protein [Streptomyces sp. NRRL B-3648]